MNYKKRNQEIIKLHKGTKDKKGLTYDVLADEYKISKARIGQICSPKEKVYYYCERHDKRFTKKCPFCEIDDNYAKTLDDPDILKSEIEFLRKPDRTEQVVRKRKILVTKLFDDFKLSPRSISELLEMDRTSILHLYESYKQGRDIKKIIKK